VFHLFFQQPEIFGEHLQRSRLIPGSKPVNQILMAVSSLHIGDARFECGERRPLVFINRE